MKTTMLTVDELMANEDNSRLFDTKYFLVFCLDGDRAARIKPSGRPYYKWAATIQRNGRYPVFGSTHLAGSHKMIVFMQNGFNPSSSLVCVREVCYNLLDATGCQGVTVQQLALIIRCIQRIWLNKAPTSEPIIRAYLRVISMLNQGLVIDGDNIGR